jgi:hypothetical protein
MLGRAGVDEERVLAERELHFTWLVRAALYLAWRCESEAPIGHHPEGICSRTRDIMVVHVFSI